MNAYSSPINFLKEPCVNLNNNNNNDDYIASMGCSDLTDKVAVHMGDGWCTFPDLDNFDSDKLLKALTLKEKDSSDSIWDPSLTYQESCQRKGLSVSALRQLEALFNLSQLLFGLSRAETVNYTFRDLQLRKYPHSFKKAGFKQFNSEGRIDFYAIFEQLVQNIIDEGGLEVTLLMYKNPQLPMVRQKCLDLISNVATVPDVAYKIMRHQAWFLDHLLIMLRDGDIVSDKIPALSVLIRLLKVMLTERMISSYMKLVDMQYIDCLVDIFENPEFTHTTDILPFFIKFEFITMQSLTVILGDTEYSQFWSDKAKTRLLNYCMIVMLKAAGAFPVHTSTNPDAASNECIDNINHIFYAEQHTNKHSLAHTIMTVTELLRNDENMKTFYRYHRPFKQLIVQLYKKYGAKSQFIRIDPGISYALNHLMRVLYIKSTTSSAQSQISNVVSSQKQQTYGSASSQIYGNEGDIKNELGNTNGPTTTRLCSNTDCQNEETKYKQFKECSHCSGKTAYCSSKCKKMHIGFHRKNECYGYYKNKNSDNQVGQNIYENVISSSSSATSNAQQQKYNRIYDSSGRIMSSASNARNSTAIRRASENLHQKKNSLQLLNKLDAKSKQQIVSEPQKIESKENFDLANGIAKSVGNGGFETYIQNGRNKRLYKYSSMNENHRRTSLASPIQNRINSASKHQKKLLQEQQIQQIAQEQQQQHQLQLTKPKNYYSKHTNSMKEIKSNLLSSANMRRASCLGDNTDIRAKLISNNNTANAHQMIVRQQYKMNDTNSVNSVHFVRPLKTSTALCLTDLTRHRSPQDIQKTGDNINQQNNQQQIQQHSSDTSSNASSSLSSESSTTIQIPKKFKTLNGEAIKTLKDKQSNMFYLHQHQSPDSSSITTTGEDTLLPNENSKSNHKRRHSATAAIYQSTTTQKIITTTTKTKTKYCEADSTSTTSTKFSPMYKEEKQNQQQFEKFTPNSQDFFYYGKDSDNHNGKQVNPSYGLNFMNKYFSSQNKNELIDNEEEEDIEDYLTDNSSDTDSDEEKNDTIERVDYEQDEEEDDDDEEFGNRRDAEEDDEDEIEGERRWVSGNQDYIEFGSKKSSIEEINEDEHDRRSHFKVVKEFEKTLEFVKNASNLKVMNANQIYSSCSSNSSSTTAAANNQPLTMQDGNESTFNRLKEQQISLAMLSYNDQQTSFMNKKDHDSDQNNSSSSDSSSSNQTSISSDDENESKNETDFKNLKSANGDDNQINNYITIKPSKSSNELKPIIKRKSSANHINGLNLIINNSIDSHMLTNSFNLKPLAINNPNKKLQKIKNKELEPIKRPQYTNIFLNHDNDQKPSVNEEDTNLFKIKNQNGSNKQTNDFKSFKLPVIKINDQENIEILSKPIMNNYENCYYTPNNEMPLSIQPIITAQTNNSPASSSSSSSSSLYATVKFNKKNSKFNELKVFSNDNANLPITDPASQFNQQPTNGKPNEMKIINKNIMVKGDNDFQLPKNSTPLFNDSNTVAELVTRRKQFLNAELNLTIAPPPSQPQNEAKFLIPRVPSAPNYEKTIMNDQKSNQAMPYASTPMANSNQQQTQYKMSTLKGNSSKPNLIDNNNQQPHFNNELIPSIGGTQLTGSLNISRISAITTETNLVSVTKTEIPKSLKKCFKEEFKRDKTKCLIQ